MKDMEEAQRQVDEFLARVREPLARAVARGEVNLEKLSPDFFRKNDRRLEKLGDEIAKAVNDCLQEEGNLEQLGDEIAAFVNKG